MTDTIKIKLIEANFHTRWHCHVCGGRTEKVAILAEGKQDISLPDDGPEMRTVRVCEQCLKGTDGLSIDQRLELTAKGFEGAAHMTRMMIGKLEVPSYAEWEAACRKHDEEYQRMMSAEGAE